MLQLATREVCLLVRIGQMGRPLPPTLRALLAAEAPVKVTLTLTLTLILHLPLPLPLPLYPYPYPKRGVRLKPKP